MLKLYDLVHWGDSCTLLRALLEIFHVSSPYSSAFFTGSASSLSQRHSVGVMSGTSDICICPRPCYETNTGRQLPDRCPWGGPPHEQRAVCSLRCYAVHAEGRSTDHIVTIAPLRQMSLTARCAARIPPMHWRGTVNAACSTGGLPPCCSFPTPPIVIYKTRRGDTALVCPASPFIKPGHYYNVCSSGFCQGVRGVLVRVVHCSRPPLFQMFS